METLKLIIQNISMVVSIFVFLITAITFAINQFKKKQKRVLLEDENELLHDQLTSEEAKLKLINEVIPCAIKKVENIPLINGETKKMLALSEILIACNALSIDYASFKTFINDTLESLIGFSKVVNGKGASHD